MSILSIRHGLNGRIRAGLERVASDEHRLTILLSLLIGALVGLVTVAFILLTGRLAARMYPAGVEPWRRLLVPTVGSLVAGWLLFRYFPLARGSGIPQTKFALFVAHGVIALRTVVGKFVCCAISLASGIALGREGPSVQIGAGLASVIGRGLGLSQERVKALIPVGGSAALAAAFNTPIAAVLFSLEEIVGDLHAPVLGAVVLSSATAWMVLHLLLGDAPLFHVAGYQLVHPAEFGVYAVLGVVGGLASGGFVRLLLVLRARFLRLDQRRAWLHPVAGGLTVGLLGLFAPEVLGVGYDYIERVLHGDVVLQVLVLLAALKIVATAVCYASGNAGGIFGPSLFIGAMVGGAVGTGAHMLFPAWTAEPGAYALVGMGAAFAGIVRTPLASVIMIFELTRDYSIIVPLMISNLIAFYVSHRLQRVPIYEAIALQDGVHLPNHEARGYAGARVADAMRTEPIGLPVDMRIGDAADRLRAAGLDAGPIVDCGEFAGMVGIEALDDAIANGMRDLPLRELGAPPPGSTSARLPHVHLDHSVALALERMGSSGHRLLPIVSRANVRQLVGLLTFADAVSSFGTVGRQLPPAAGESPDSASASRALLRTLGVVLASIATFIVADVWLARAEATETRADAVRLFDDGKRFEATGNHNDAIARYRGALGLDRLNLDYQLALARSLLASGRASEARSAVGDALGRSANDGAANRAMARVLARLGETEDAIAYYHRAILGQWRRASEDGEVATRIELVEFLAAHGQRERLLSELLALQEHGPDAAVERRIAALFLTAGAPERSLAAWSELRRSTPGDPDVHAGIGEAELARRHYRAAEQSFQTALRLRPDDAHLRARLALCDDVLALDPTRRGLTAAQRLDRSVALMALARVDLERCPEAVASVQPSAPAMSSAVSSAQDAAAEANLDLAERMWRARTAHCPGLAWSPADEQLALVLTGTAQ